MPDRFTDRQSGRISCDGRMIDQTHANLDLAIIGNSTLAALVDRRARIVWACMPRLDGDPVLCSLLNAHPDGGLNGDFGFYEVTIEDFARSEQHYRHNTAILVTTLFDQKGQAVEITDFAPRFRVYGRMHRPATLVRMIKPIAGNPRIRIRIRPRFDYGAIEPEMTRGSNHIRYVAPTTALRLTTDVPVSYVVEETPFILESPVNLMFGPDESLTASLTETAHNFLRSTNDYWTEFCRYLALPFEWQDAVIRAAITLKLCSFEETGAIVAAITTSIPEAPHSSRNWDYRYCWLRDSYFVVHALNRLGATKTMEDYLHYITNIVAESGDGYLGPLFSITLRKEITERTLRRIERLSRHGTGPGRQCRAFAGPE